MVIKIAYIVNKANFSEIITLNVYKQLIKNEINFYHISYLNSDFNPNIYNIICCNGNILNLIKNLENIKPDIIFIEVSTKMPELVLSIKRFNSVKIERLNFDIFDELSHIFDYHIFASKALFVYTYYRYRLPYKILSRSFISPHPISPLFLDNDYKKEISPQVVEIREKYLDELLIGMISRPDLVRYSNQFLRILIDLKKKIKSFKFLAIGGLPQPFKLKIKNSKLLDNIIDIGPVSNEKIPDYLRILDIYTNHSIVGESFGRNIIEAMFCGLPIIVNSTPWTSNAQVFLVDNQVTGYVARSERGYVNAIVNLAINSDLRKLFGTNSRKKAINEFDPRNIVQQFEDFLFRVVTVDKFEFDIREKLSELNEILYEKRKRENNVFDRSLSYSFNYWKTYLEARKEIAGGYFKALEALIKKLL